jgi:hypothetical protein
LFLTALGIYLAYTERSAFAPVLQARSSEVAPPSARDRHAAATA